MAYVYPPRTWHPLAPRPPPTYWILHIPSLSGMDSARSVHSNSTAATLWAHLSRKGATGQPALDSNGPFVPPCGPQDKTATTMRVLLHDTQMNLEKFSGNVERLTTDVQSAAQSIKQTSSAFEQEHDKLMGDIVDLGSVNLWNSLLELS